MHDRARPIALVCLLLLTVPAMSGCKRNAATGKLQLDVMSRSQEIALGVESRPQILEGYGQEIAAPGIRSYVTEIGSALAAHVEPEYADIPWVFTMLDSEVVNAFALPGGQVFVSRALAVMLGDGAELAGVLGHEIGHVTARHGNQRITKQIGFNVAMGAVALVVGASDEDSDIRKYGQIGVPALAFGGNVVLLSYGRNEELEADMLGVRYMSRACYNPVGQRMVMEVLQAASKGGSRPPEWLSTHPESQTRISRINKLLSDEYAYTQNSPDYVMKEDEYQRRMLARLNRLGPPAHGPTTSVGLLDKPSLWCAHCNPELALAE